MDDKTADLYDITFFVPCYNEENNVVKTLETIVAATATTATPLKYEVLVIDDCSRDATIARVEEFQRQHPGVAVQLKKNARNRGLGRNYVDGAFLARGRYYMLVNGDNAEPKDAIARIIAHVGEADMIIPYFGASDHRSPFRRNLSRVFTSLVNVLGGHRIRYYNGPVAHRRYNVMRWHADTDGFAYQAEIITRVLSEGGTYVEVQIPNLDRQEGNSKAFRFKNILSVGHSLTQIFFRRLRGVFFARDY
jgi:glycosyltransferase involved in cell wall biosynthesis